MISTEYCGTVPMIPEFEKMDFFSGDDDVTSLDVPKIYFDGVRELYAEDYMYDWILDSVIMVKDDHIVKFTESTCNEMLLKDEDGESVWVDGVMAQIVGADVTEREDLRVLREYWVEVYDLKKGEKKRSKVVFEESSPMDEHDFIMLKRDYDAGKPIDWNDHIEETFEDHSPMQEEEFRELEEAYPPGDGEVFEAFMF